MDGADRCSSLLPCTADHHRCESARRDAAKAFNLIEDLPGASSNTTIISPTALMSSHHVRMLSCQTGLYAGTTQMRQAAVPCRDGRSGQRMRANAEQAINCYMLHELQMWQTGAGDDESDVACDDNRRAMRASALDIVRLQEAQQAARQHGDGRRIRQHQRGQPHAISGIRSAGDSLFIMMMSLTGSM